MTEVHPALVWAEAVDGKRREFEELLERCEEMLTDLEWTNLEWYENRCRICVRDEDREHEADCELAALLSDLRKHAGAALRDVPMVG